MGTLEDKIAAETKLKQLKAEQQKVEAGEWSQADFTTMMDKELTRKEDRLLFGMAVVEDVAQPTPAADVQPVPEQSGG